MLGAAAPPAAKGVWPAGHWPQRLLAPGAKFQEHCTSITIYVQNDHVNRTGLAFIFCALTAASPHLAVAQQTQAQPAAAPCNFAPIKDLRPIYHNSKSGLDFAPLAANLTVKLISNTV